MFTIIIITGGLPDFITTCGLQKHRVAFIPEKIDDLYKCGWTTVPIDNVPDHYDILGVGGYL